MRVAAAVLQVWEGAEASRWSRFAGQTLLLSPKGGGLCNLRAPEQKAVPEVRMFYKLFHYQDIGNIIRKREWI